ncbi:MAG: M1 family aminopeptidase [Bacteroidota bacterium]
MKNISLIILITIALTGYDRADNIENPHYDIRLSIDPAEQYIDVECKWVLPKNTEAGTIIFYLHRQLQIEEIMPSNGESVIISRDTSDIRYMPYATKYTIKTHALKNNRTSLQMKYSGRITEWSEWSPSVIGEEWTELGSYFPWYPRNKEYGPFTYEVEVFIDDKYHTFMMGNEAADKNWASYTTENTTNDIVLCASEDLRTVNKEVFQYDLCIAHSSFPDTLINSLTDDIREILALFNRWFPAGGNTICLVESMREEGGGYARLGGIYLSGLTSSDFYGSRKAYTRYLAHEISHLWWYRADANTWEDWLNEGFAEYTALLVLRELYGQDYFEEQIEKKREQSEGTDPVWQYDRNREQAYTILYDKAPLLLYELEGRIGIGPFKQLMWDLLINKVSTTYEFKRILTDLEGEETAEWFVEMLKER